MQNIFINLIFFVHFNSNRCFYINFDVLKRWDFVVVIYYIIENSNDKINYSRFIIQSIIFFSKLLNNVKQNYWFTKLKIIDIIWVVKRIRHMINSINKLFIVIYIDYFIIVLIFKQIILITFNIDKLNLRLIRVSQYLYYEIINKK